MTPKQRYSTDLKRPDFAADAIQAAAVEQLNNLYQQLEMSAVPSTGVLSRWWRKPVPIKGLYLWGSVGRGKTYLMDCFYDGLQATRKQRVHYHRFMLDIHAQLKHLPKSPNPLPIIGRQIAAKIQVLCLDEFHVSDVADAMLLAGLLQAMLDNGMTLVATSNTAIDNLYLNGLQRERFMAAIQLLKNHTIEIDLQQGVDYRLAHLEKGQTYMVAIDGAMYDLLAARLNELAPAQVQHNCTLDINGRAVHARAESDDVVWFDFEEICNTPRAAQDYLEIACHYHTVLISAIPKMGEAQESAAKRFMHLIDALYDHHVKLLATAQAPPQGLYFGRQLKGAFDRTVSRLIEMNTRDYLALPHKL
ncbi:MAG: cell division protein ZapE [Gammaproteobacteria bacterium]|nr:cell division protein ZapE [Gammaproteobacteria bacterium]